MFNNNQHKFLPVSCIMLLLPAFFLQVALSDTVLCIGKAAHIAVEPRGVCSEYYGNSVKSKTTKSSLIPKTIQKEDTSTPCIDIPLYVNYLEQTHTKTGIILSSLKPPANDLYASLASIHLATLPAHASFFHYPLFKTSNVSSIRTTVLII